MTMANESQCRITVKIEPDGAEKLFLSDDMRALVERRADTYAKRKAKAAQKVGHKGPPKNGYFGYRMKRGDHTWIAVICPTDPAGYAIGKAYGIKHL